MPRFKSMAVHMAAASLGTSCLASTQWLHTWQQHRLARHASLCISYCMQCRIAWHLMSRINSMAVHMAAASLGTLCLASYQLLHVMQHRLACHASLQINGCAHGSSIAWHVMPRFNSMAAHVAAASCHASTQCRRTWQQHNLALDALLQNQWPGLRISRQLVRVQDALRYALDCDLQCVQLHAEASERQLPVLQ